MPKAKIALTKEQRITALLKKLATSDFDNPNCDDFSEVEDDVLMEAYGELQDLIQEAKAITLFVPTPD